MTAPITRLAPGLYDVDGTDGAVSIERDDEGIWGRRDQWWIHCPSGLLGPYDTLRDARTDAQ